MRASTTVPAFFLERPKRLRRSAGGSPPRPPKGTPTTRIVLEKFRLIQHFDHVQGTDGFPSKPAPDVILTAIAALGAKPEDCLMVGDSPPDMEAGRRAGVKTCAVRYGYGKREQLALHNPDYWVDDLRELAGTSIGASAR
jgi:phosphoglycolate phosphatase